MVANVTSVSPLGSNFRSHHHFEHLSIMFSTFSTLPASKPTRILTYLRDEAQGMKCRSGLFKRTYE